MHTKTLLYQGHFDGGVIHAFCLLKLIGFCWTPSGLERYHCSLLSCYRNVWTMLAKFSFHVSLLYLRFTQEVSLCNILSIEQVASRQWQTGAALERYVYLWVLTYFLLFKLWVKRYGIFLKEILLKLSRVVLYMLWCKTLELHDQSRGVEQTTDSRSKPAN